MSEFDSISESVPRKRHRPIGFRLYKEPSKRAVMKLGKFYKAAIFFLSLAVSCMFLFGCANSEDEPTSNTELQDFNETVADLIDDESSTGSNRVETTGDSSGDAIMNSGPSAEDLWGELDITKDIRTTLSHGPKGAEYQKYIVLHDTEGEGSAQGVVDWWASNGNLVAAHFVINKDGSIIQCVPLDEIAHHAGYGDTGHNKKYAIKEDGRDDMKGTVPIGKWAADYGMNAWSVGIEMVHVGGSGDYPKAQLKALDKLIAYIDAHYGFESKIIDHKSWRTGNSDTSKEFAKYFKNYKKTRTHDGK